MSATGGAKGTAKAKLKTLREKWLKDQGLVLGEIPDTASKADYDKLVAAVDAARVNNENIAAFTTRVKALGAAVEALASTVGLLP